MGFISQLPYDDQINLLGGATGLYCSQFYRVEPFFKED